MNTTVDSKKMREKAAELSEAVHTLNENVQKLVAAVREAQSLKDKAKQYDGQELDGEQKEGYTTGLVPRHYITKYFAHVNNSEGGTASSGMRSITGSPKENIYLQITKILDFTDNDLPAVADCIEQGIDEVETTLSKNASERQSTSSNDPTRNNDGTNPEDPINPKNPTDSNDPTNEKTEEQTSPNNPTNEPTNDSTNPNNPNNDSNYNNDYDGYHPSGGGSPSYDDTSRGTPSDITPQYKTTSGSEKEASKSVIESSSYTKDNLSGAYKQKNTSNIEFNNSNTPSNTNNIGTGTIIGNNTNNVAENDYAKSHMPSAETNSDNPTSSASVILGNPNLATEDSKQNFQDITPVELLGSDNVDTIDQSNSGDSIINGVNRVVPNLNPGKTIQTGSAIIPGVAGISAAAAAGLGSKAVLDNSDNFITIHKTNKDDKKEDEEENKTENNSNSHKYINIPDNDEKDENKAWLYGMGVGLGAIGSVVAKKEYDKNKEANNSNSEINKLGDE